MTRHVRDLHVEFEAADEDAQIIVAGLAELVDRRLEQEREWGRLNGYCSRVERQVREEVGT